MAIYDLGRVRIVPKGAYSIAADYEYLDLVTDSGSSYLYINPYITSGTPLTSTSHWLLIAGKGDQGIQGEKGDIGNTAFATFDIDTATGDLIMTYPDGYTVPAFSFDYSTGDLEVTI